MRVLLFLCYISLAHAFSGTFGVLHIQTKRIKEVSSLRSSLPIEVEEINIKPPPDTGLPHRSSPIPPEEPYPITPDNIQFAAGLLGATAGTILGGHPLLGAGLFNYAARTSTDTSGDVIRGLSSSSLELYNYLVRLDERFTLVQKGRDRLNESYNNYKLKLKLDSSVINRLESTISDVSCTVKSLADEVGLENLTYRALGFAGDVNEKVLTKGLELNKDYNVVSRVFEALGNGLSALKG